MSGSDKPRNKTWYQFGFDEALEGLTSCPPMDPGHKTYEDYLAGFEDGEAQADREDGGSPI